ncbi:hypothetical protein TWF694_007908 [Orbilia ellipsospora]|uniref:Uncharacterized protein n=1 Tax=Orbilia ellipsospora TaxID=2528407 RepID=A0AAV9XKL4_9PEZI
MNTAPVFREHPALPVQSLGYGLLFIQNGIQTIGPDTSFTFCSEPSQPCDTLDLRDLEPYIISFTAHEVEIANIREQDGRLKYRRRMILLARI